MTNATSTVTILWWFRRLAVAAMICVLPFEFASAEPYLAIYKGMQCSSCHSNSAGGGMRNAYGNVFGQSELPAETIGADQEGLWTGEVTKWLSVGADLRADYRYTDTPNEDSASEFDVRRATVYVEGHLIPNRLSIYVDQQFAPGSSLNREAFLKLKSASGKFFFTAGQFFLPFGFRLQDDSAFIRLASGINFFNSDRGVQAGYENGPWSTQVSVTNGSGGGTENDDGKQVSFVGNYVRQSWRVGISLNDNESDLGDRQMQNVFVGLKTGSIVWLAEVDFISDKVAGGGEQDAIAGLLEGNWQFKRGHNLKVGYDYFDPDTDLDEDHQTRWSVVWEYTPIQFLQGRFGARFYDGIPQVDAQNRDEFFAELHGFF